MRFIMKDVKTDERFEWDMEDILSEINRDRSDKWTDYNELDWKEGWYEWCEGDIYSIVEILN